jgi:hypothetical protein
MGIDATGVETGMRRITRAVKDWKRELTKGMSEAGSEQMREINAQRLLIEGMASYSISEKMKSWDTSNTSEINRIREMQQSLNPPVAADSSDDYNRLRDYFAELERQSTINLQNMQEIARIRLMNQERAAEQLDASRASDFIAYKDDLRRQEREGRMNADNMREIARVRAQAERRQQDTTEAKRERAYQDLKQSYRLEEIAAREHADAMAVLDRYRSNQSSYRMRYGDPYINQQDTDFNRNRMRQQQAGYDAATRQDNADQQEANAILQRNMTLQERYAAQIQRITELRYRLNRQTNMTMLSDQQAARATTNLTIQTIRQQQALIANTRAMQQQNGAAAAMTGVFAQASFAAEDFIQGMAFGDVRSALLGASNNLTMVVRGLAQAGRESGILNDGLMTTLRLSIGLPVAAIGLVAAWSWAKSAAKDVRSLSEALEDATHGLKSFDIARDIMQGDQQFASRLRGIDSVKEADQEIFSLKNAQALKDREIADAQRKANIEAEAFLQNQLGGMNSVIELEKQIAATKVHGTEDEVQAAVRLEALMASIRDNARLGNAENAIAGLREMYEILNAGSLFQSDEWYNDLTALNTLEDMFASGTMGDWTQVGNLEGLREIRETLTGTGEELSKQDQERLQLLNQMIVLEEKRAKLKEQEAANAALEQRVLFDKINQQKEDLLFQAKATEGQKALLEIQKQQQQLMGDGMLAAGMLGAAGMIQLGADQLMNMEFLKANQARVEQDILDQKDAAVPFNGALVQNAFQAQADAFQQVNEQRNDKPNRQLTELKLELQGIRDAIANGGVIRVVP